MGSSTARRGGPGPVGRAVKWPGRRPRLQTWRGAEQVRACQAEKLGRPYSIPVPTCRHPSIHTAAQTGPEGTRGKRCEWALGGGAGSPTRKEVNWRTQFSECLLINFKNTHSPLPVRPLGSTTSSKKLPFSPSSSGILCRPCFSCRSWYGPC